MAVMDGLASYEIFKTGLSLFFMILFLCCAIGLVIYTINQNYVPTIICNVTTNSDKSQILTYTINNKQYVRNVQPISSRNNDTNVVTTHSQYPDGKCTLYYPSANPDSISYGVNTNPTTITEIIAGVLCFITILMFIWFNFLRANRGVAGVVGGLDAAQTVVGMFRKRR
jgi:hypothetical protein